MTMHQVLMRTAAEGIAQGAGALTPAPPFIVSMGVSNGKSTLKATAVHGLPAVRGLNYCSS